MEAVRNALDLGVHHLEPTNHPPSGSRRAAAQPRWPLVVARPGRSAAPSRPGCPRELARRPECATLVWIHVRTVAARPTQAPDNPSDRARLAGGDRRQRGRAHRPPVVIRVVVLSEKGGKLAKSARPTARARTSAISKRNEDRCSFVEIEQSGTDSSSPSPSGSRIASASVAWLPTE